MTGYLDSSILMRFLLNQENKLKEFNKLKKPISSKILKAECLRTLDRARTRELLTPDEYLSAVEDLYEAVDSVEFIEISDSILDRVGSSFATPLGTLDAIHLCSALAWKELTKVSPLFLTHDEVLAKAAKSVGFEVLGVS